MERATPDALFAEAMKQHMGIFLKTAYAFAEPADRDDLVQEMLLAVWQALPGFDDHRCKLSTFLYRVANNRALNWNRSRRRYHHKLQVLQNCPQLVLERSEADADATRLEWLYRLIRELPPLDRTVLMLHFDHLSHREIGEVTGLSENNIGVRLHRIKKWITEQKGTNNEL
ncbi:MAG: sigma-70 family RNA polymerase sigma factor [Verrucomicrobia bacterium]|nr:MAG: sigma-70 family RNA polymerase sigma factor [Verrucomicrobiota bacterium]